ncbi:hypothetical protein, partial [Burkholderia contaminans]
EVRPEYERNSPRMSSNSYVNLKIATCLVRYADDRLIDQRFPRRLHADGVCDEFKCDVGESGVASISQSSKFIVLVQVFRLRFSNESAIAVESNYFKFLKLTLRIYQ